jgi:hypothetical protein
MQRLPIGFLPLTQVSIFTLRIGRVTFGLLAADVRHVARRNRDLAKSAISLQRNPARAVKRRKIPDRASELW